VKSWSTSLALAALISLAGCGGGAPADDHHAPGDPGEPGHHDGEAAEAARTSATHYSDGTEMFVEYPVLVAGKQATFAAHMSWMDSFKAVNEGRLAVELIGADGTQRTTAAVSNTPGIFRPEMTPGKPGTYRLVMRLDARGRTFVHDLGPVRVHPTQEAANKATPAEAETGAIGFTKEVQWQIPFATVPAAVTQLEDTMPVTIDVRLAPEAEAVVAAPVAGIVRTASVPVPGGGVRRGQTLASISAQLGGGEDVASLDLAIARGRIEAEAARREVARMNSLYRAEAVPQRRLQDAQTALRLAQAEVSAATRRKASLAGGGPGVPLVSPISGRILSSSLVRGASVAAGDELMRIGDLSRLWLVAHVPESQAARVVSPTGLDLTRGGGTVTYNNGGAVRLVSAGGFVDPRTRTMDVIFATGLSGLSPGQRLQGRLRTGFARSALAVPASAVIDEGGQTVVYVQVEGEAFERRPVTTGLRSGALIAVTGDLKPGERVVSVGAAAVRAAGQSPAAFGEGHAH
jgi:RND family efflux transporter MFP subunit